MKDTFGALLWLIDRTSFRSGREKTGRSRGGSLTNSSEADLVCTLLTGIHIGYCPPL